jgi:hypothetical protein
MSSSVQAVTQSDPTDSWKDQWDQMLDHIKGMNAGEALMYVMYMMLPEVGNYLQGTLGSNADTQNDLSRIIGDMSDIQDQFNQGATGKVTTDEAQQALDDYNDIQSVLKSDPSLENIADPLTNELEPLFSGKDASKDAHNWNKAWKESTKESGSDADDTLMTSYTNAFSQASSTVTGESQTIQSQAQYIGDQLQEFFGEQGSICQSETSGVTVMVNNENTN